MSVLAPDPRQVTPDSPPKGEIGAETATVGGANGWASFVDELEYVPTLSWPSSVRTYHQMRSDSQVEALHLGTVQPIREFRWSIDPNKAPAALVEQVASDFGLPIRGHEDDAVPRGPREFDFDAYLDDVLLAPLYGHFHHEIVGEQDSDGWHMVKLAPRHPRTIMEFQSDRVGTLLAIRQNIAGAGGWARLPEPIPASKLVTNVWRSEAGSHVGRSMLRAMYREWLIKDRVLRVAAINLERGGGVPVVYGAQGASDNQIKDLAAMASQFKAAEGGGGALPFGTKLEMHGTNTPDAVALLTYLDQCMARVWALMLLQLGLTGATGNRALGAEFAIYAARAQRAMAKWVCRSVNRFLDSYAAWNTGDSAKYSPLLHFEQEKPDSLSIAEFTALIEARALNVDPELEGWLRNEYGLPPQPEPQTDPTLGDLSPEEVALVQNSRTPPPIPDPPKPTADLEINAPTMAASPASPLLGEWTVPLPDRTLRRQPTGIEARSRTDFRAMDTSHRTVLADVQALMRQQIIPAQVKAVGDQIENLAMTKTAMAGLKAPVMGADDLKTHLLEAARQGANAAAAELSAQGVTASIPDDAALSKLVGDQAKAVAEMAANGLSLAAQRRAQALVGGNRTAPELRSLVESSLNGMAHQWTMDQLNGAVQLAQNAGRGGTFGTADQSALRYYASEILDVATCLHPQTTVTTADGPKRASEVTEHDYLLTHAGRFVKPTAIRVSEVENDLVRIHTASASVAMTAEHSVLIVRDGYFVWANAGEVAVGDLVVSEATTQPVGEPGAVDLGLGQAPDGEAASLKLAGFAGVGFGSARVPVVAVGFDHEAVQKEVDDIRANLRLKSVTESAGLEDLADDSFDAGLGVRGDVAGARAIASLAFGAGDDPKVLTARQAGDDDGWPTAALAAMAPEAAWTCAERSPAAFTEHVPATASGPSARSRAVGVPVSVGDRHCEFDAAVVAGLRDAVASPTRPRCRVFVPALARAVFAAAPVGACDLATADLAGASWTTSTSPTVNGSATTTTRPLDDTLSAVRTRNIHQQVIVMPVTAVTREPYAGPVYDFTVPPDSTLWADGVLVHNCDECVAVDGTEYPDLGSAVQDYAAGGYVDCAGGPRCRGTIVAVSAEVDPLDPSATPDVVDVGTG